MGSRFENHSFGGRDFDFFAGFGVTSLTSLALLDGPGSKTWVSKPLFLLDRLMEMLEDRFDGKGRNFLGYSRAKVFSHALN